MVEPNPESEGPFYRFNVFERQVYFSAFHLRPETAPLYVEALRKHRIQWLTGYGVSLYLLARFIREEKLKVPPLRAVIFTAEKLTPEMRQVMEVAYGCRVYEEYSSNDTALFASECEHGRLHVSPDVGVVEILKSDGTHCEPGETGEVVTTSLLREYQPFIRYRLADVAMWDSEPCSCGRSMPILREVVGRTEDVLVSPDGRYMVHPYGSLTNEPNVWAWQVIQETLSRIRVKVVPTDGFDSRDVRNIISRLKQRLGPHAEVIVEPVDEIPRTAAGKFKLVVSLLHKQPGPAIALSSFRRRP
jgi:phenylacetate-CoA ligase